MKNIRQLALTLPLSVLLMALFGCGQKGPLYLPPEPKEDPVENTQPDPAPSESELRNTVQDD
ncbi:LPS translocon maturation chaperone LptM [Echinimonas agarilytica]|uniref:Lipoprotein n=1 Tax=Echinimonas agarilytica TaxID=1215918 RepID=A0AA41W3R3_9GAMM|nr:lipoprotein [Echinimonas agarilytica]MCM2678256.1 lipoprotein [Echinimonas agarilytica]